MKKYLLGLLTVSFSLIAFSSAISVSCVDGGCSPSEIEVGPGICDNNGKTNVIFNGNFECEYPDEPCILNFYNSDINQFVVVFQNGELNLEENFCMFEGDSNKTFNLDNVGVVNLNGLTLNGGGNNGGNTGGGDDNTGGDDNIGGGVISDGFGSFTPVITGVKDTIFQLIPLVIYIGIGVLISILGFYAIRWLVNWIGGKINSYFNSKRD